MIPLIPLRAKNEAKGLNSILLTGDAADLFTAIQQHLGLKLESAKVPVEVLVIDRVEKPSEN